MKNVTILGAGYAGLRTLRELQKSKEDFSITLVDRNRYHFESTDLHEVAAGTQPWEKITYELSDVVDPAKTTFIQAYLDALQPSTVIFGGYEYENELNSIYISSRNRFREYINS